MTALPTLVEQTDALTRKETMNVFVQMDILAVTVQTLQTFVFRIRVRMVLHVLMVRTIIHVPVRTDFEELFVQLKQVIYFSFLFIIDNACVPFTENMIYRPLYVCTSPKLIHSKKVLA